MNISTETVTRRNRFATLLERAINASHMTQIELAHLIGYPNQNIITMFKKGTTRLPLGKVVPMAKILGQDPGGWLRAWFEAYEPEAVPDLNEHIGMPLTWSEKSWIVGLRTTLKTVPSWEMRWAPEIEQLASADVSQNSNGLS